MDLSGPIGSSPPSTKKCSMKRRFIKIRVEQHAMSMHLGLSHYLRNRTTNKHRHNVVGSTQTQLEAKHDQKG